MKCPRCQNTDLAEASFESVSVERCPGCHGLWLEDLELETLISRRPKRLIQDDRAHARSYGDDGGKQRLNCPRCKGTYLIKLNCRHRPGTIVDSCTVCYGTWLDAGELTKLTRRGVFGWLRGLLGAV